MTCLLVLRMQRWIALLASPESVLCLRHMTRIALYHEHEYKNVLYKLLRATG